MKKLSKTKIGDNLFAFTLVLWPLIQFTVFWFYIRVGTIASTFMKYDFSTNSYFFYGLRNYQSIFRKMILGEDIALHNAFWNSFQAIGINIVILPIAIFSAYAFYKKMPFHGFFNLMFYIPHLISVAVLTMIFTYMCKPEYGPLTLLLEKVFGLENVALLSVESDTLWPMIWIYCIWSGIGGNIIMMRSAMNKIPKEICESAILDGCGFFRELWSITLPMCISTIGVFFIMVAGAAPGFLMQPMLIVGGSGGQDGRFMTVAWFIFSNATNSSPSNIIAVTTIGLVFTLVNTPLIVGTRILVKKLTPDIA